MVSLQRVDASMFIEVCPLLRQIDPSLTETAWSSIFNYKWEKEEDYCGYGLFYDKKIVGFLGLIFSKRLIENKIEYFCNLTSWIVKEQYRSHSLSLIQPVMELRNYTITDLTPSITAYRIGKRLGFKQLESALRILLPFPIYRNRRCVSNLYCTGDNDCIETKLRGNDLKIFYEHRCYQCKHLLVCDSSGYCYIIYTKVESIKFPYCYIQYISNLHLFSKYSRMIRSEIAKESKTSLVLVDSRLVRKIDLPFSCYLPIRSLKLYKSSSLRPEQIDNLYSELILLNLNVLPTTWWEIRRELLTAFVSKRFDPYGE